MNQDGKINYFEFSNKLDYGDDVVPATIKPFEKSSLPSHGGPAAHEGSLTAVQSPGTFDSTWDSAAAPQARGGSGGGPRVGSRASSRAGSRAGSRLGMVDSSKGLAMEREAQEQREERRQVAELPLGTPR